MRAHPGVSLDELARVCLVVALSAWAAGAAWGADGDTAPPELGAFDFNPHSVDVTAAPAQVTCTMAATDAAGGAGIVSASCRFRSPAGNNLPVCYAWQPSSGGIHDGVWTCSLTMPQFIEAGEWGIYEVLLADGAGNQHSYTSAELGLLGFPTALHVTSAYDVEGPVLGAFDFGPRSIDVTTDPAQVTFTMSLTDAISGVLFAGCSLRSPSGAEGISAQAEVPSSGTINDGTWDLTVVVPRDAEPGNWVVASVQLADRANNYRSYDTGALGQIGFPTELQVASGRDVERPALTAFELAPRSVDVTAGPATVTCEMSASDARSGVGVRAAGCEFRSPDGAPGPLCFADHPSSGDVYDGVWICSVTIPQFVQPGTWVVSEVHIADGSNNVREYSGAELDQLGFPSAIQVISNHDVLPPDLAAFDFLPRSVDVLNGPASVTCAMRFSDELAGVQFAQCNFQSASGHAGASCYAGLPSSGTINDGAWTCLVTLPQGSEPGTWVVTGLQVADRVGNGAFYGTNDLDQRGFGTQLDVTADQAAQDSDGDGVIDSADACPNSVVGATVHLEGVDSGVPNPLSPNGCTLSDAVSHCVQAARNPGRFASCVRQACDLFVDADLATPMQCGALVRAAARSHAGRPKRNR